MGDAERSEAHDTPKTHDHLGIDAELRVELLDAFV